MLRILFGAPAGVLRSIVTKYIKKVMKRYGFNAKIDLNDFVVYEEGGELLIHVSGDLKIKKEDLLNFLNNKMDSAE